MKNVEAIFFGIVIFVITVAFGIHTYGVQKMFQSEAIENGAAQYNPQTGEFEWIKK